MIGSETASKLAALRAASERKAPTETTAKVHEVLRLASGLKVRKAPEVTCNDRFSKPVIGERP